MGLQSSRGGLSQNPWTAGTFSAPRAAVSDIRSASARAVATCAPNNRFTHSQFQGHVSTMMVVVSPFIPDLAWPILTLTLWLLWRLYLVCVPIASVRGLCVHVGMSTPQTFHTHTTEIKPPYPPRK